MSVAPSVAQEYDNLHACDEYAAHPNDPNRWAKGVTDEEIVPGPAVKYCREAVKEHGETPRFQFQLGRALWAAQQLEEGLNVFLQLEEKSEYPPVYAYLGDAYMYGIGGVEPDQELAVSLYQIASEEGFGPATETLAALTGGAQEKDEALTFSNEETSQDAVSQEKVIQAQPIQQENPFNKNKFLEREIVNGLYSGNLAAVRQGNPSYIDVDKAFFYLSGFLKPFQENYNFRDGSCVYFSNPMLVRIVNTKVLQGTPGMGGMIVGNGKSLKQNLDAGAAMGFEMMGDILKGMQSGQGLLGSDYGRTAVETNLLAENGEKDGTRLIAQHGCESETTRRIFANLTVFVTGQGNPILSTEETKRVADVEQENIRKREQARQSQLRVSASGSCVKQFKKEPYCACIISSLDKQNIEDTEWKALGSNFREVVSIAKKYPDFANQIKSCRTIGG